MASNIRSGGSQLAKCREIIGMSLVEKIDAYCVKEGITVKEFERRCKIANATVHKWRVGLNQPSLKTIVKISEATGTELGAWV